MMAEEHEKDEQLEDDLVAGDDTVILRALKVSAIVLVAIIAVVVVAFYILRPEQVKHEVEEKPIVLPKTQDVDVSVPKVAFSDVTVAAGIDFVHVNGATGDKLLPETMGPGCAFFDFDQDEDEDLLLVNGMPWPGDAPGEEVPTLRLYTNDGRGFFKDVTAASGIACSGISAAGLRMLPPSQRWQGAILPGAAAPGFSMPTTMATSISLYAITSTGRERSISPSTTG